MRAHTSWYRIVDFATTSASQQPATTLKLKNSLRYSTLKTDLFVRHRNHRVSRKKREQGRFRGTTFRNSHFGAKRQLWAKRPPILHRRRSLFHDLKAPRMNQLISFIGVAAAALTSLSYIPQVRKAWPRKFDG